VVVAMSAPDEHHDAELIARALSDLPPIVLCEGISIALLSVARLLEEAKAAAQIVAMPVAAALTRRRAEIDALLAKPDAAIGAGERATLTRERDRIAEIITLTAA
jgi:hypothetical protein